jgi:hypothetical protein
MHSEKLYVNEKYEYEEVLRFDCNEDRRIFQMDREL